jgi:hypothetical protein
VKNCGRRPPGRGEGRRPRPHDKALRAAPTQTSQQCTPTNQTTSPALIIRRAQRVVDSAATLALDLAAVASESGRAHHARAALAMLEAAHYTWIAAETLAEGACI